MLLSGSIESALDGASLPKRIDLVTKNIIWAQKQGMWYDITRHSIFTQETAHMLVMTKARYPDEERNILARTKDDLKTFIAEMIKDYDTRFFNTGLRLTPDKVGIKVYVTPSVLIKGQKLEPPKHFWEALKTAFLTKVQNIGSVISYRYVPSDNSVTLVFCSPPTFSEDLGGLIDHVRKTLDSSFKFSEELYISKIQKIVIMRPGDISPLYNSSEIQQKYEDRKVVSAKENVRYLIYGVFDGHGGNSCAVFLSQNIVSRLRTRIDKEQNVSDILFYSVFSELNKDLISQGESSGSTCSIVIIDREKGAIHVATTGDSSVAVRSKGKIQRSVDHTPTYDAERITKLGGWTSSDKGVERVQGVLAVSRSFGHASDEYRDWITPVPHIYKYPARAGDEIVLATDGLWDHVSTENVFSIVDSTRSGFESQTLCNSAKNMGSSDDITCIYIKL